jgi:hypothetical protein
VRSAGEAWQQELDAGIRSWPQFAFIMWQHACVGAAVCVPAIMQGIAGAMLSMSRRTTAANWKERCIVYLSP